ncbi:MAG: hypothetical protein KJO07_12050, partial [Deltaproteobacteria bacterium]|nr:hypothetical protein [Deltaproteobacteria bacterium]
RRLATWALAGTSAATLAAAAGFGVATWLEHRDLDDRCGNRICPGSEFNGLETRRLTADILFGVGVATGAAAAILWLTADSDESGTSITAGPGEVGIGLVSRF